MGGHLGEASVSVGGHLGEVSSVVADVDRDSRPGERGD